MQLLYYQAPLSAVILLLLIPVFEPVSTTITVHWTAAVVVSCQHTLTSIWHCGWQHMVVLYCHLHYSYSYSHLYLLVESHCTEGHVHEQQHLHFTLHSELCMCPMYFLVCLFYFFWFGNTREPGTVSLSNSFGAIVGCFSFFLSLFVCFFFVSLIYIFSFSNSFLKMYITCMCSYAQFCALNSNGMQYSFL